MVRREKVIDARGRAWIRGSLDADEYWAEATRTAREQARRSVAARLSAARGRRRPVPTR